MVKAVRAKMVVLVAVAKEAAKMKAGLLLV
jgi:hypothetical protein